MIYIIITIFLTFSSTALFSQSNKRLILGETKARELLKESLSDTTLHNVISKEILLKDKKRAITFAERILFDIYGKKEVKTQKPYEVYLIDNYWVLSGTLPKNKIGGSFLMIIDFRNYRIIRITHGK